MKNFITILLAIVAGCTVAQAQGISTEDAAACGAYLVKHPMDTIVSKTQVSTDTVKITRVFLEGGQPVPQALRRVIAYEVSTSKVAKNVSKDENGNVVAVLDVQTENGAVRQDTMTLRQTTVKDMTDSEMRSYLNKQTAAVNPEDKDYEGKSRHNVYAGIGAGAVFGRSSSPEGKIFLGYETCHFLWELEGGISSNTYTNSADYRGRYISLSGVFKAGWKFWQDSRFHQSLSINGIVGYGGQTSDGDEALTRSRNFGLNLGGSVRYTFKWTSGWLARVEAGARLMQDVPRGMDQDMNSWGGFVTLGVGHVF